MIEFPQFLSESHFRFLDLTCKDQMSPSFCVRASYQLTSPSLSGIKFNQKEMDNCVGRCLKNDMISLKCALRT
ncbi:hypothetical protein L6164_000748 [Bauhinia variegata]|uniref:Uncharacterized protein n=1 Tax=Bauhinia variegata TaxID=167791 RepID=A0ACB9Q718_BAUVA|nr:hypothetical protein L6164_000748 [Bauhinia variegata]